MRTLVEALVALLVVIFAPIGICQLIFRLGVRGAEVICGHNTWIQFIALFIVAIVIVSGRSMRRHKSKLQDQ